MHLYVNVGQQPKRVAKSPLSNFYVFDDEGYVWLQMTHTTRAFIDQLSGGLFRERWVLEVQDTPWNTFPIVESDAWIDGSPTEAMPSRGCVKAWESIWNISLHL